MRTDGIRLAQILINLISNAIKYTKEGEVAVETELNKKEKTMTTIIRDTGVGMTQDQMTHLFTNYTKIINNRELNREGVGLGLTISKNLAKALGGDIFATSSIGIGSSFTLKIPA